MNSSREVGPLPKRLSSSQVPLMASHISTVSAVRTARALVRAISKQLRMEEGLAVGGGGGGRKAEKSGAALLVRLGRGGGKGGVPAGGGARRFPFVGRADIGEWQRGEALRDLEDACEIFRALHVTRKPVKIIGGTREHWAY